jgi:hypothetical protein
MDGAYRYHRRHGSLPAQDSDAVTLQLLVEERRHLTYSAERHEAVITNAADYVARFIQGTDGQPSHGSTAQLKTRVASPVANGSGQKPKQGVDQSLLISGDRSDGCQSPCEIGKIVLLLGLYPDWLNQPEQDAKDQGTERSEEPSSRVSMARRVDSSLRSERHSVFRVAL